MSLDRGCREQNPNCYLSSRSLRCCPSTFLPPHHLSCLFLSLSLRCSLSLSLSLCAHFHFHFGVVATEIHQNHINSFALKDISPQPPLLRLYTPAVPLSTRCQCSLGLPDCAVYHSRVTAKTFDGPSACFLTRQPLNVLLPLVVVGCCRLLLLLLSFVVAVVAVGCCQWHSSNI